MRDTYALTANRITYDLRDANPSTGARQVAEINHAVYGLGEPAPDSPHRSVGFFSCRGEFYE